MKNIFYSSILKMAYLVLFFLSVHQLSAQEIPDGVSVNNTWLKFESEDIIVNVVEQLGVAQEEWYRTPTEGEGDEEPCAEDDSPVQLFENAFADAGYTSIGKANRESECAQLAEGVDPAEIEGHFLATDPVIGAIINDKGQYQVGSDIYMVINEIITIQIANEDIEALFGIMDGRNPYDFKNVTIINDGPLTTDTTEVSCNAEFEINGFEGTQGTFSFTGTPSSSANGTVSYNWTFGDGQSSTAMNPSHGYNSTGQYTVCVEVTYMASGSNESCTDQTCKTIDVGEDCMPPFFSWSETGLPGQVHFTDLSGILSGNITSWSWSFGDGNTSTQQHPTHTYLCDKSYTVSLTITTDEGCETSISLPVGVTSHNCCGKAKDKGEVLYSSNSRKIKYDQHHINIPFIRKVVAEVKNYKKKSNGNFAKERGDLKVELIGNVFTKSSAGCKCEMPQSINSSGTGFNKKTYTHSKNIGQAFRAKDGNAWSAKYSVNGSHIATKVSLVYCQ